MNDNGGGEHPKSNRRTYEPRRFKSFVAELHREAQQRHTHTDDHSSNETPLVTVTRRLVIATIALVAVGILGFGAAVLQWRALLSTDERAASQVRVMRGQLKQMKASTRLDMRAYVDLKQLTTTPDLDGSGALIGWKMTPTFINTGKTPATNVAIALVVPENNWVFRMTPNAVALAKNPLAPRPLPYDKLRREPDTEWEMHAPPDPEIIFSWPYTNKHQFMIHQSFLGAGGVAHPVEGVSNIMIKSRLNEMFYFGSIHYDDFFGTAHISKFCMMVDPYAIINGKRMAAVTPCAHWNCMDASCFQDKKQYQEDRTALTERHKRQRKMEKHILEMRKQMLGAIHNSPPK